MTDIADPPPPVEDRPLTQDGPAIRLYLVDGSGYLFRAYHALPPLTRKSDGLPVGAVAGFCNMLWKFLNNMKNEPEAPTHLAVTGRYHRPAFVAGIQDEAGAYTGVEVTYLTLGGRRADNLRLSRKTVGLAPGGCAVRLDPAATEMLVGEGVHTTLSATERFGLPGWALLSTRNLRAWRAPAGVRSVVIAADRGADGEASAGRLRQGLLEGGVAAVIELPPHPFGDWNDWAQGR